MKLALVTGGTKRLGAAIARGLAVDGYDLALHTRSTEPPEADLLRALAEAGSTWRILRADLGEEVDCAGLVDQVAQAFGRAPDLLVNNASMLNEGGWRTVSRETLAHHFEVNCIAPIMLVQALAAALPADGRGAVINILDQRIVNPPTDQAAYTASKLALGAMTRVLARAFAPQLRVNAVAPGLTLPGHDYSSSQVARLAGEMPLEILPTPAAIADAVLCLARAEAITGQVLCVDAGASLESWRNDFVHMFDGAGE